MHGRRLRIGRIPYGNLFPVFFALERHMDCSSYEFVDGVPSRLNRMLREGEVDLSPSSSIEYLRDRSRYGLIEGHSISARGRVGSVFLFATRPLEDLTGTAIAVSSQSETSIALLRIIMKKFCGSVCSFLTSDRPESSGKPSYLLIGDEALRHAKDVPAAGAGVRIYDLAEIWHRRTGLPFVFALWIVRRELFGPSREAGDGREALFERFVRDLDQAKEIALGDLPGIAGHSPLRAFMSEREILSYWELLDYDLGPEHLRGLELFEACLKELDQG